MYHSAYLIPHALNEATILLCFVIIDFRFYMNDNRTSVMKERKVRGKNIFLLFLLLFAMHRAYSSI